MPGHTEKPSVSAVPALAPSFLYIWPVFQLLVLIGRTLADRISETVESATKVTNICPFCALSQTGTEGTCREALGMSDAKTTNRLVT